MRWRVGPWLGIVLASACAGCKTCDLVEAELREQTNRADMLQRQLDEKKSQIVSLQTSLEAMQPKGSAKPPDARITPEDAVRRIAVTKIELGLLTGGKDTNNDGIDDAIVVVIVPKDGDGDSLKAIGTAEITLAELAPTGVTKEVARKNISLDEIQKSWRPSLFGAGYAIQLPMPAFEGDQLRISAKFTTVDGRMFQAERDVKIKRGAGSANEPSATQTAPSAKPMQGASLAPPTLNAPPKLKLQGEAALSPATFVTRGGRTYAVVPVALVVPDDKPVSKTEELPPPDAKQFLPKTRPGWDVRWLWNGRQPKK